MNLPNLATTISIAARVCATEGHMLVEVEINAKAQVLCQRCGANLEEIRIAVEDAIVSYNSNSVTISTVKQ